MISGNRRPYFDREFSVFYIDSPSIRYAGKTQLAKQKAFFYIIFLRSHFRDYCNQSSHSAKITEDMHKSITRRLSNPRLSTT